MDLIYQKESYVIRGIAFEIYKQFRNAYKEKIYQNAYEIGLKEKDLIVEKEKRINVFFKGKKVGIYIPDLVINEKIIIELKAKPKVTPDDIKQFWYYLKGSNYKVGFLINFGAIDGVEIIRRVYDSARNK